MHHVAPVGGDKVDARAVIHRRHAAGGGDGVDRLCDIGAVGCCTGADGDVRGSDAVDGDGAGARSSAVGGAARNRQRVGGSRDIRARGVDGARDGVGGIRRAAIGIGITRRGQHIDAVDGEITRGQGGSGRRAVDTGAVALTQRRGARAGDRRHSDRLIGVRAHLECLGDERAIE